MQVILYNCNLFASQTVHVFDTDKNEIVYTQPIELEDTAPMICALANKLNISEVKISGNKEYATPLIEEIKTTYSLTYGNNNINVEVI